MLPQVTVILAHSNVPRENGLRRQVDHPSRAAKAAEHSGSRWKVWDQSTSGQGCKDTVFGSKAVLAVEP